MNDIKEQQYKKFLAEKDELIESLTKDFTKAFEENPEVIWSIFTPVHEAAAKIRNAS